MTRRELRIGTSGYQYDHWRGIFYPRELPRKRWFEHYAQRFDTVEINNTFYRLPRAEVFDAWREAAPRGFLYALKLSRFVTHFKHLRDPEQPIARFLARAERLEASLGPILVQLPPRWKVDLARLQGFLAALPRRHRWAIELRDPSWLVEDVYRLLERYSAALCLHDNLEDHPWRLTAGWCYVRFHGPGFKVYSRGELRARARQLRAWRSRGHDAYVYFNNDFAGHAVRDAAALRDELRAHPARARRARPGPAAGRVR